MKVLYVIDSLQTGGAETSLLEISSRLKKFTPIVCVLYSNSQDLRDQFILRNVRIIELDIKSRLWWVDGVTKLKRTIASVKPDVVHATLFKSEILTRLVLRGKKIPHIGSFVNDSYARNRYAQQSFIRNLKLNVVRLIDFITARWVDHFMAITKTVAATNSKALLLDPKKITCIYRGRNVTNFPVFHPPLTDKPFTFLIVARLLRRKGYLELFNAAKLLQDKGHSFLLRVAGDGPDYHLFKEQVAKLNLDNKVEFLFNRKDVPALLQQAHCFVFPSHYEGQGGSLVEAMLAAKPIIASDIPVFREQIVQNQTGLLFRLFEIGDLARAMEWMMSHYSEGIALGFEARKVAMEQFNVDNTARLHEELYINLLTK